MGVHVEAAYPFHDPFRMANVGLPMALNDNPAQPGWSSRQVDVLRLTEANVGFGVGVSAPDRSVDLWVVTRRGKVKAHAHCAPRSPLFAEISDLGDGLSVLQRFDICLDAWIASW